MNQNHLALKSNATDSPERASTVIIRFGSLWHFLLLGILALFVAGCALTVPSSEIDSDNAIDSSETIPVAIPDQIWPALAQAVRRQTIATTDRLAQFVVVLARNGELSERDVAAFEAVFPKITTTSRELTDADVRTLLELGRGVKR